MGIFDDIVGIYPDHVSEKEFGLCLTKLKHKFSEGERKELRAIAEPYMKSPVPKYRGMQKEEIDDYIKLAKKTVENVSDEAFEALREYLKKMVKGDHSGF